MWGSCRGRTPATCLWEDEVAEAKDFMATGAEASMAFGLPFFDSNSHWQLVRKGFVVEEVEHIVRAARPASRWDRHGRSRRRWHWQWRSEQTYGAVTPPCAGPYACASTPGPERPPARVASAMSWSVAV